MKKIFKTVDDRLAELGYKKTTDCPDVVSYEKIDVKDDTRARSGTITYIKQVYISAMKTASGCIHFGLSSCDMKTRVSMPLNATEINLFTKKLKSMNRKYGGKR